MLGGSFNNMKQEVKDKIVVFLWGMAAGMWLLTIIKGW